MLQAVPVTITLWFYKSAGCRHNIQQRSWCDTGLWAVRWWQGTRGCRCTGAGESRRALPSLHISPRRAANCAPHLLALVPGCGGGDLLSVRNNVSPGKHGRGQHQAASLITHASHQVPPRVQWAQLGRFAGGAAGSAWLSCPTNSAPRGLQVLTMSLTCPGGFSCVPWLPSSV